jgi:hypothetical protein
MSQQITVNIFLIKKLNVELQVVFRSTGLVRIEPYQCKEENIRLWSVIAETQTVLAQTQLNANRSDNNLDRLYTVFQHNGWQVRLLEERKEYSL